MQQADWNAVRDIYIEGIASGNATFEKNAPEWNIWDAAHHKHSRLVADRNGEVLGWAALSPVSQRHVYRGVAEVSIYVAAHARGHNIDDRLLAALISESEKNGLWTLQAGIFPENVASIALHKKHGFRVVGQRERIGQVDGRWRDVCFLERRSTIAGGEAGR